VVRELTPADTTRAARRGLSAHDAAERLARDGPNELPVARRRSTLRIVVEVVREPMFGLLLAAGVLYLVLGNLLEALVLMAFACLSVMIAVVQQGRSERVLEALRDLTSPRALVMRDGERRRIPGREVVCEDTLLLTEGDRIPADGVLVSGQELEVDEALLTGESIPVRKHVIGEGARPDEAPGGEGGPQLYSGTLVLRGSGAAVVTATGPRSAIGRIGRSVAEMQRQPPRLQVQTRRLVFILAIIGFSLSACVVVLYGVLRGAWLEGLLGGIALVMSLLPEEFPLVLTVFTVMGAWRLSRSGVLTRQAAAIETLGAATVLCTDKTGTLTRNQMSVSALASGDACWMADDPVADLSAAPALAMLLDTALLASPRTPTDPMERALHELAGAAGHHASAAGALLREFPLRPEWPAVTRIWEAADGARVAAAKGAPEAIAQLCRMHGEAYQAVLARADALARQGMRVLGAARAEFQGMPLPDVPQAIEFRFAGLVAFADPLRETVPEAVRECRSAGIRVIMITGDYPETARTIALQAGIDGGALVTGAQLDTFDDAALAGVVSRAAIFARITPSQKLRIVNALKAGGEVVAMTGDGVNDAPALKAAHIGIAMGGRGTDVAREAAALVLLDDDFGSIVHAVRLGRRIYDNLSKAMAYILAIHAPIAGLALLPVLLGLPLLLTPMLIAFLELVIDPTCSLVFEAQPAEENLMRRPPRNPRSPLLPPALMFWSLAQGALALATVAVTFLVAVGGGMPEGDLRALAFVTLLAVNFTLIFVNRSFGPLLHMTPHARNPWLWRVLGLAAASLAAILAWPAGRAFFGLGPLHADDLALCAGAALLLLAALEGLKHIWRDRLHA
jgi:Ca2+-transporting ATPase